MHLRVELSETLIARVDAIAGAWGRGMFIQLAVTRALESQVDWDLIRASLGSIKDHDHEWDRDPAAWVRDHRRGDHRRID